MTLQETGKFLTVQDVLLRQHFRLKYFGTTISFLQVESQVAGLGELGVALGARVRLDTLVSHYMVPSIARFEEGTPAQFARQLLILSPCFVINKMRFAKVLLKENSLPLHSEKLDRLRFYLLNTSINDALAVHLERGLLKIRCHRRLTGYMVLLRLNSGV